MQVGLPFEGSLPAFRVTSRDPFFSPSRYDLKQRACEVLRQPLDEVASRMIEHARDAKYMEAWEREQPQQTRPLATTTD